MDKGNANRPAFASEEADRRIEGLRWVFAQGFLTKDELERLERHVLARVRGGSRRAA